MNLARVLTLATALLSRPRSRNFIDRGRHARYRCPAAVRARDRRRRGLRPRRQAPAVRAQCRRADGSGLDDEVADDRARAWRCSGRTSAGRRRSIAPGHRFERRAARRPRFGRRRATRTFRSACGPTARSRSKTKIIPTTAPTIRRPFRAIRSPYCANSPRRSRAPASARSTARLVDTSLFADPGAEGGTGAIVSPIVVNDNLVDVTVTPGGRRRRPGTIARIAADALRHVRRCRDDRAGQNRADDRSLKRQGEADGSHTVTITGTMPAGSQSSIRLSRARSAAIRTNGVYHRTARRGRPVARRRRIPPFDRDASAPSTFRQISSHGTFRRRCPKTSTSH